MTETTQILIKHGLPLVFTAVLLEQLGLPLPACSGVVVNTASHSVSLGTERRAA